MIPLFRKVPPPFETRRWFLTVSIGVSVYGLLVGLTLSREEGGVLSSGSTKERQNGMDFGVLTREGGEKGEIVAYAVEERVFSAQSRLF